MGRILCHSKVLLDGRVAPVVLHVLEEDLGVRLSEVTQSGGLLQLKLLIEDFKSNNVEKAPLNVEAREKIEQILSDNKSCVRPRKAAISLLNTFDSRFIFIVSQSLILSRMTPFRVGLDILDKTFQFFCQFVHRLLTIFLIILDCLVKVVANLFKVLVLKNFIDIVAVQVIHVKLYVLKSRLNAFFYHGLHHLVFSGTMASLFVSLHCRLLKICHHR